MKNKSQNKNTIAEIFGESGAVGRGGSFGEPDAKKRSQSFEGIAEVDEEVGLVLDADGEPDETVGDAEGGAGGGGGGGGGEDGEGREEGGEAGGVGGEWEGDHAAEPAHLAAGQRVLRVGGEARVDGA